MLCECINKTCPGIARNYVSKLFFFKCHNNVRVWGTQHKAEVSPRFQSLSLLWLPLIKGDRQQAWIVPSMSKCFGHECSCFLWQGRNVIYVRTRRQHIPSCRLKRTSCAETKASGRGGSGHSWNLQTVSLAVLLTCPWLCLCMPLQAEHSWRNLQLQGWAQPCQRSRAQPPRAHR